jgi:hypothetical protein
MIKRNQITQPDRWEQYIEFRRSAARNVSGNSHSTGGFGARLILLFCIGGDYRGFAIRLPARNADGSQTIHNQEVYNQANGIGQ